MSCDLFTSFLPMNHEAEPMPDFLQRTLGKRARGHNHHAAQIAVFFVGGLVRIGT